MSDNLQNTIVVNFQLLIRLISFVTKICTGSEANLLKSKCVAETTTKPTLNFTSETSYRLPLTILHNNLYKLFSFITQLSTTNPRKDPWYNSCTVNIE